MISPPKCVLRILVAVALTAPMSWAADHPVVLVDEAHGEKFVVEAPGDLDLSQFADRLRAAGCALEVNHEPLTGERLARVDGVVISGAFKQFSEADVDALLRFVESGGRLAVMLHIPFPLNPLLRRLHVDFANGVIREREHVIGNDPLNFSIDTLATHPLTRDVSALSFYGAWALMNEEASAAIIARTSPRAWIDLNGNGQFEAGDASQAFGLAVAGTIGKGEFVVFGDDAIFQNQFLKGGNATLAENLICWLAHRPCGKRRAT